MVFLLSSIDSLLTAQSLPLCRVFLFFSTPRVSQRERNPTLF